MTAMQPCVQMLCALSSQQVPMLLVHKLRRYRPQAPQSLFTPRECAAAWYMRCQSSLHTGAITSVVEQRACRRTKRTKWPDESTLHDD